MKLFIDTNIFLRFLVQDDQKKFATVKRLIELIEEGNVKPYTSNIVILELVYVLTKVYEVDYTKVIKDIDTLLQLRNLTVIERTDTRKALSLMNETNIKYADVLISTQVPSDMFMCTYDKDFYKLPNVNVKTPEEVVKVS